MALKTKTQKEDEELPFPVEILNEEPNVEQDNNVPTIQEQKETLPDNAILNPAIPMRTKVGVATDVADCLSDLVRSQGLVVTGLNGRNKDAEYVTVEGWEVLGTMLGIVPITEVVETIKK